MLKKKKIRQNILFNNRLDDVYDVIVVYDIDTPFRCVSFKRYDEKSSEVKHIFIKQEYRSKGIKKTNGIISRCGKGAEILLFNLEFGESLVATMALSREIGYKVIPNYGQYKDMPDSIWLKKIL